MKSKRSPKIMKLCSESDLILPPDFESNTIENKPKLEGWFGTTQ
jgi:hypothetical protein